MFFFFFQAEDGIRDIGVTGVQTCALPISFGNESCKAKRGTRYCTRKRATLYSRSQQGGSSRGPRESIPTPRVTTILGNRTPRRRRPHHPPARDRSPSSPPVSRRSRRRPQHPHRTRDAARPPPGDAHRARPRREQLHPL